jgi:adenosylhomocysteine nucleosidase
MIGIMGAMQEEIAHLVEALSKHKEEKSGMRSYHIGELYGIPTVIVFSRWGKVAAATTATHLLLNYGVDELIFTGVAGAVNSHLNIGDVVIGNKLFQHDMDARPLMPRYEIPLLKKSFFETSADHSELAYRAADRFLSDISTDISLEDARLFGIDHPKVLRGNIASGDRFIALNSDISQMKNDLPELSCVEMEGAAVAQVCYELDVPFSIIRTISDVVGVHTETDVMKFVNTVASKYSNGIIREICQMKRLA